MAAPAEAHHLAALIHSIGRRKAVREVAAVGSAIEAYTRFSDSRSSPPWSPQRLADLCAANDITLLTFAQAAYPALLRHIPDPPPLLYARGDTGVLLRPTVAMVGARRCSRSGVEVAGMLARDLAGCGLTVISGLARGIDTAAHRAALPGGVTVAVVGSGLLRIYPPENRALAAAILEGGGLLLSEYPPLAECRAYHFPERNRLISGLALGVIVVEAGEQSGSLITARMALEQGREVCAVPGPVTHPASRGCHRLLRQGAALVECAEHVLEALGMGVGGPGSGPGRCRPTAGRWARQAFGRGGRPGHQPG
jgi:DNA processing protein